MSQTIIGIMGPGSGATDNDKDRAYNLGKLIAQKGYITLTGGRPSGVMEVALKGAKDAGGQTIGILPGADKADATAYADIVIPTAMASARNNINILASDVVIACGVESGTLSEIALALKTGKSVIVLSDNAKATDFLNDLGKGHILLATTADEAMKYALKLLESLKS